MATFLSVFFLSFLFWIGFTWKFTAESLIIGFVVSILISLFFRKIFTFNIFRKNFIKRFFKFIFIYIPNLIIEMIKANFEIAKVVLDPKLPINPGFVKKQTILGKDDNLEKLIVASSITLTPGTLTVDVIDDCYFIHTVFKGKYKEKRDIVSTFDKLLK